MTGLVGWALLACVWAGIAVAWWFMVGSGL